MKIKNTNNQFGVRTNLQVGETCYRMTAEGNACIWNCQNKYENEKSLTLDEYWGCYLGCHKPTFTESYECTRPELGRF